MPISSDTAAEHDEVHQLECGARRRCRRCISASVGMPTYSSVSHCCHSVHHVVASGSRKKNGKISVGRFSGAQPKRAGELVVDATAARRDQRPFAERQPLDRGERQAATDDRRRR